MPAQRLLLAIIAVSFSSGLTGCSNKEPEKPAPPVNPGPPVVKLPQPVQDEALFKGKSSTFWIAQLKDRDRSTREEAIMALAAIGVEGKGPAADALLAAVNDMDPFVTKAIADLPLEAREVMILNGLRSQDPALNSAVAKVFPEFLWDDSPVLARFRAETKLSLLLEAEKSQDKITRLLAEDFRKELGLAGSGPVTSIAFEERIAGRAQLRNNMKLLANSIYRFQDRNYSRLPTAGFSGDPDPRLAGETAPKLSWRVAILPFLASAESERRFKQDFFEKKEEFLDKKHDPHLGLYYQFKLDESWDSPHNRQLISKMPSVFQPVSAQKPRRQGETYLQFVTGPGTLYPTSNSTPDYPRSFFDGTSNTVMIVEAAESVPWTKPADFAIDVSNIDKGFVPRVGAFSDKGFFAALGDRSVRFVDRTRVSDKTLRQAFNPADGNQFGRDW